MSLEIKICGITNYDDAACAVSLGADYLGFVFAASPRQVTADQVYTIIQKIRKNYPDSSVQTVGVFVNETKEKMTDVLKHTGIDLVQLHGDEQCSTANNYAFPWYKALRIKTRNDVDTAVSGTDISWNCDRLLVDTKVEHIYGGTGIQIDSAVAVYAKEKIKQMNKKFFLAGGLRPETIHSVLTQIQPDGIDVSSGVEECEGKKSFLKLHALFEEIDRGRGELGIKK